MDHAKLEKELRRIVSIFIPSAEFSSFTTIDTGHINRTYRINVSVSGEKRDYLLQNLNTHVFTRPDAVTHNIVRCASFLKLNCPDYPYEVLNPVAIEQGEQFLWHEGKNAWRMFNFIQESKSLNRVSTTHEAKMIGEAFGVFLSHINHDDPNNYKVTIPDFHNFTKRYRRYKNFLSHKTHFEDDKVNYLISSIDQFAGDYLHLEEMDFPTRIIHHDTKANNVLLYKGSGQPKCIIDLDTLMPGDIFSDFGDLMRTVFNPFEEDEFPENGKLVDEAIINSLVNGFLDPLNQLLTNIEKEYLIMGGKKITLLQVLRFLMDHLEGDVYYQVNYPGHNLYRAMSQMNLYMAFERSIIILP